VIPALPSVGLGTTPLSLYGYLESRPMKAASIRLPRDLYSRLSAFAVRSKTTRSRLIRQILERHLRQTQLAKDSALVRAGDLVGIVKGTSRDLSTRARHMKGFGS
jgi:predicted DNA-binding protein